MRLLPKIVFALYLIVLIKVILFKGPVFYEVVPTNEGYIDKTSEAELISVNVVPFQNIRGYLAPETSTKVMFYNLFGNILLFIPYGFMLPFLFKSRIILFDVFYSAALLSLSFELFQLITRTGQFDVDDIILNTTGGLLGYLLLRLYENVLDSLQYRRRRSRRRVKR